MKNLFFVRLIVIFLFASLAHIDMVNATYVHRTPKKVNKVDRQEIDKKLADLNTLSLRKVALMLANSPPNCNYSYLYLDKNDKVRKYEHMSYFADGAHEMDSVVCYYDSDGELLKLDRKMDSNMEGDGGFFYVKNGRIVDYYVYVGIDDENEGDKPEELIIPSPTIGDSLKSSFYSDLPLTQYLNVDTLINYISPNRFEPDKYSYKAIENYNGGKVHISTPFNNGSVMYSGMISLRYSSKTSDKLDEIRRMPLKKYLLHYEYIEHVNDYSKNKTDISYVYLDSLNRVRIYETMFKDDDEDNAMSCFFDEDGTLLYVKYYNGSERGYFYVKDSLLCGESYKNGNHKKWEEYANSFKLEDALKNHEILMFPLSSCLHVTMLPNLTEYYENIEDDETIEYDKNKKFTLPPYALPVPLQQPY